MECKEQQCDFELTKNIKYKIFIKRIKNIRFNKKNTLKKNTESV